MTMMLESKYMYKKNTYILYDLKGHCTLPSVVLNHWTTL